MSYLSYFQLGTPRHCPICIMFSWQGVNAAVHPFLRSAVEDSVTCGQLGKESVLLSFVSDFQLTRSHSCCPTCLYSAGEESLLLSYLLIFS